MPPKDHPERGRRRTRTGPAKRRMRYPQHFMLRKVNNDTGEVLDLREWYGIHEIVHSSPKGAKEGTPECIIVLEDLRVAALNLLKGAGEKMPVDIVGSVEKDVRTIFEELYNWTLDIEKRHGFLSPLSMAARFLATGYGIRMVLTQPTAELTEDDPDGRENDLERKFGLMAEFAHVWHPWHMEVFGEHAAAYGGLRHETSLLKATQSRQKGKEIREQCLMQYLNGRDEISAGKIADGHYGSINAHLSGAGLRKFPSKDALKRAVLRARRANKSAKP